MTEQDVAVEAAAAAARILANARPTGVRQKGEVDWVSDVDLQCEAAIREVLGRHTPDVPVLGEEGGWGEHAPSSGGPSARATRWVVDPLDGTTNFLHGFPVYAVSVGLEVDGVATVGVVIDVPRNVVYAGTVGAGATANGAPIRASDTRTLERALAATGFPYDRRSRAAYYLRFVERVLMQAQCVRRAGAAALDLAWVAAGHLDLFWEFDLGRWDVCAGSALVRAAGGKVSSIPAPGWAVDAAGDALGDRPCPIASNPWLHEACLALLGSIAAEGGTDGEGR